MLEQTIQCNNTSLNASVFAAPDAKACMLFLSGGDLRLGKQRFVAWQEQLQTAGVSSLSFDHSGVNGSGAPLKDSSLATRIEEAMCVTSWMRETLPAKQYVLYGVSMGGYVALGTIAALPNTFSKLILHSPAAYSAKAERLAFGEAFSEEIRREGGWEDSPSFEWLRTASLPTLFIEAGGDEIIPFAITERYKAMRSGDPSFKTMLLHDAPHGIWQDTSECAQYRHEILEAISAFVQV